MWSPWTTGQRNISALLANTACKVHRRPGHRHAGTILRQKARGWSCFKRPGPSPAATAGYNVPAVQGVLDKKVPLFGQSASAPDPGDASGKTRKMGAAIAAQTRPSKDLTPARSRSPREKRTAFCVLPNRLPKKRRGESTSSLFDGNHNEGLRCSRQRPSRAVPSEGFARPEPTGTISSTLRRDDRQEQGQVSGPCPSAPT